MSPLLIILIGIACVLSVFIILPFLFRPKYSVTQRLGSVQLTNELSSIRISAVIITDKKKQKMKGLFVYGENRIVMGSMGNDGSTERTEIFPITEREIDEVISLLSSQPVFAVNWRHKHPITFSVNAASGKAELVFENFSWMDYCFNADLEARDMKKFLTMFEALKREKDFASISL